VIGVELSSKLVKAAAANIARMKLANVRLIEGDALAVKFDRPGTLLFMYNPFRPEIMKQVVANVCSAAVPPKFIVYANPLHGSLFGELAGYELALSAPGFTA
jgi:tRNA/tmRNA/rRNA uracil-C5-methylase (TrmA/RlmC/RlmD family)